MSTCTRGLHTLSGSFFFFVLFHVRYNIYSHTGTSHPSGVVHNTFSLPLTSSLASIFKTSVETSFNIRILQNTSVFEASIGDTGKGKLKAAISCVNHCSLHAVTSHTQHSRHGCLQLPTVFKLDRLKQN